MDRMKSGNNNGDQPLKTSAVTTEWAPNSK